MKDAILVKGKVWTGEKSRRFCEAFFAEEGVITYVGDFSDAKRYAEGKDYRLYDYGENLVMPGMTDAHIHATAYAKQDLYVNLSGVNSLDEIKPLLLAKAKEVPSGEWIRAINFNETLWNDPRKPDIDFIDSLGLKNPIIISRYCGHFHAVNTIALKKSGLWEKNDVNIARKEDGSHLGQLTEGAAGPLIEAAAKIYETPEYVTKLIENSCLNLASEGITAVHACDAPSYALGEDLYACQSLYESGRLPIRWACYHDQLPNYNIKSGFGNEMLFFAGLKLFADGTLGGRTCAMREDFSDDHGNMGLLNHSDEEMRSLLIEAQKRGINVQIHAIGDRALEQTIDSINYVTALLGEPSAPYRINHAIVCPEDLLQKIRRSRVTIDLQPIQAHTDRGMTPFRVGRERMKTCYAFKSLYDSAYTVTGSSDAPIEDPNPWLGIWAAVNMTEMDGTPLEAFNRDECLSIDEALNIYTANPWKALGKGEKAGTISLGKFADFTVVDGDPFALNKSDLRCVTHLATFVGGKMVWSK